MSPAQHDGQVARPGQFADAVAHLALRALQVRALGGDGAGVDERVRVVECQPAQRGAQRLRATGRTLAPAVALHALVGGEAEDGHRVAPRAGARGVDGAVPSRVLRARAVVAAGPGGGRSVELAFNSVHAGQPTCAPPGNLSFTPASL